MLWSLNIFQVLLIGGGVANFTDVASTFKGIVTGAIDGSFWESLGVKRGS